MKWDHKMQYYSDRKNSEGFTLIEVLIAILLLTIGLLALVSVTVMVIKGNSLSQTRTTATTLAKDQMEELKNTSKNSDADFDSIASSTWSDVTDFPGYQRQWTVTTTTGNSSCTAAGVPSACCNGSGSGSCPVIKNILMEVRWTWQNNTHTVSLNTIITKG